MEKCDAPLAMMKNTSTQTAKIPACPLCKELNQSHHTIPLDALEVDELAQHALEAISKWAIKEFGAEDAKLIRHAMASKMDAKDFQIDLMELEQFRYFVIGRMRALQIKIAKASISENANSKHSCGKLTILDGARQAIDLAAVLMTEACRKEEA